jgi:hypothetical protein
MTSGGRMPWGCLSGYQSEAANQQGHIREGFESPRPLSIGQNRKKSVSRQFAELRSVSVSLAAGWEAQH